MTVAAKHFDGRVVPNGIAPVIVLPSNSVETLPLLRTAGGLVLFPWQLDVLRYTAPRAARRATPPVNGRVTAMIPTRLPALQAGAGRSDRRYFPSASTSDFALSFMVLTVLL